jgi:serine/threonine protein phosphatase PrpC
MLADSDKAPTMVAGGAQTSGALPVQCAHFDGAIYSSRGRGYARYNEDGAELFVDDRDHLYAAVFDQAGGLGGRIRGAASQLAARETFDAFKKIAKAPAAADPAPPMVEAVMLAHLSLVQRAEGEVTTAVLLVARPDGCTLVSSGDSAGLRFDREGHFIDQTMKHEAPTPYGVGALTHALGLVPEEPTPDTYRWPLGRGEWIVLCTDGLLDAGLDGNEVGAILKKANSAEDAVNTLATKVLRRMILMKAKPDNLTIVAVKGR